LTQEVFWASKHSNLPPISIERKLAGLSSYVVGIIKRFSKDSQILLMRRHYSKSNNYAKIQILVDVFAGEYEEACVL
jgi:hypothetical protein